MIDEIQLYVPDDFNVNFELFIGFICVAPSKVVSASQSN